MPARNKLKRAAASSRAATPYLRIKYKTKKTIPILNVLKVLLYELWGCRLLSWSRNFEDSVTESICISVFKKLGDIVHPVLPKWSYCSWPSSHNFCQRINRNCQKSLSRDKTKTSIIFFYWYGFIVKRWKHILKKYITCVISVEGKKNIFIFYFDIVLALQ